MIAITTRSSIRVKNLFLIILPFAIVVPRRELLVLKSHHCLSILYRETAFLKTSNFAVLISKIVVGEKPE